MIIYDDLYNEPHVHVGILCTRWQLVKPLSIIQMSNSHHCVLRAGCRSPSSIRLCPERSWILPDTCADVSRRAPPWAECDAHAAAAAAGAAAAPRRLSQGEKTDSGGAADGRPFEFQLKGRPERRSRAGEGQGDGSPADRKLACNRN